MHANLIATPDLPAGQGGHLWEESGAPARIVSTSGDELPFGTIGHIAVQGPPNFMRYENMPVGHLSSVTLSIWEVACGTSLYQFLAARTLSTPWCCM